MSRQADSLAIAAGILFACSNAPVARTATFADTSQRATALRIKRAQS